MKRIFILTIILLIVTPAFAQTYTVERVVDGNTIKLTNGERVRLIGIDTPESKPNDKAKRDSKRTGQDLETITKMGQEATEFVKGLVKSGQQVRLEIDIQDKDKYGRLLAYVYSLVCEGDCAIEAVQGYNYEKLNDGWYVFINATIIKAGYATPMTIPPNVKHADLFQKLNKEAKEQQRGFYKGRKPANGLYKIYYNTGELWWEVNYKDGKKSGLSKKYSKNGDLLEETIYEDNKVIGLLAVYPLALKKFLLDEFEEEAVSCIQDVKECPDGSYVGRVPPTCEFKECPD